MKLLVFLKFRNKLRNFTNDAFYLISLELEIILKLNFKIATDFSLEIIYNLIEYDFEL
jgi:hypothetical protein